MDSAAHDGWASLAFPGSRRPRGCNRLRDRGFLASFCQSGRGKGFDLFCRRLRGRQVTPGPWLCLSQGHAESGLRQSATVGACERHGRTKTPRERSPTCSESSFDTAKRARCPATARQGPPLVAIEFQDPRNRKRDRFDIGLRLGACLNPTLRPRVPALRRFRYVWIRRRH